MTRKEKLVTEYINLLKGFDKNFNPNNSRYQIPYLTTLKIAELMNSIAYVNAKIEEKKTKELIENYYATPEGMAFKTAIENNMNALVEERSKLIEDFTNTTNAEIEKILDNGWTTSISFGYKCATIEIGMKTINPERKAKGFEFEFGHTFMIRYDNGWNKEELSMNYPTLGSFDLINGNGMRQDLLMGMAIIANHVTWLYNLKKNLNKIIEQLQEISDEYNHLKKALENPVYPF